jgi:MFS family permease
VTQSNNASSIPVRSGGGALALLGSRRFGPLFATQFLSAFNDNALKNALVLMIAYRTHSADALSAGLLIPLAGGLFILPFFLCSASAGALADTRDKAWLARIIKLVEIAVMVAAAAGVIAGSTIVLLALLFAMGVEAAFFGPIKYAILPDLLAPDELLLGNALVEAGTFLAILLGTIAGMLIATGHGEIAVATLIVLIAIAAWAASLMIPSTPPAGAAASFEWNFAAATARLIGSAAERPVPFRSMLGISWFWLVGALYLSQFPSYVRFVLGSEETVVTLFLAVFSVGVGAGSMLCNRLLRGRISARTVPWGILGLALFSIDVWLANPAPPIVGALTPISDFLAAPALADPRRSVRDRAVRRRVHRAALRAAADRQRRAAARPHDRRQQYRQCRGDGAVGDPDDGAGGGRNQHPGAVSADRDRQPGGRGTVLAPPAAVFCGPRTGTRRGGGKLSASDHTRATLLLVPGSTP